MSKRGMSHEEKKHAVLKFLHALKEPYAMPDLESEAAQRGIRSAKEAALELEFEGQVQTVKLSSTPFYYSFPSTQAHEKRVKLEELTNKVKSQQSKLAELKQKKSEAEEVRKHPDRQAQLELLANLRAENKKLQETLDSLAENDPAKFEDLKEEARIAVESANRWTDNIWNVKKWAVQKFNVQPEDFDKTFGTANIDYVEIEIPD